MFRLCGLVEGAYPAEPPAIGRRPFGELRRRSGPALPVARALHVNVFDILLELRFSDQDLARIAEQIFARILAGDGKPANVSLDIGREGDRYIIAKGEMAIEADSPSALAGALEQAVTYLAIERTDFLLEFSAAVLERRGTGFLLPAPPGGGKTTLAAAMMQLGWNYGSDDIALMRRGEARLRCAPMSLCLKQGSWSTLLPLMPQIEFSTGLRAKQAAGSLSAAERQRHHRRNNSPCRVSPPSQGCGALAGAGGAPRWIAAAFRQLPIGKGPHDGFGCRMVGGLGGCNRVSCAGFGRGCRCHAASRWQILKPDSPILSERKKREEIAHSPGLGSRDATARPKVAQWP